MKLYGLEEPSYEMFRQIAYAAGEFYVGVYKPRRADFNSFRNRGANRNKFLSWLVCPKSALKKIDAMVITTRSTLLLDHPYLRVSRRLSSGK
jgi:hypothetical protein